MATTYTTKCRRCNGTGFYFDRGQCFGCNFAGTRTVTRYTAEEKAQRQIDWTRQSNAVRAIKARAEELYGRNTHTYDSAYYGALDLRDTKPERFTKLLDSLDAGRLDDVVRALVIYRNNG